MTIYTPENKPAEIRCNRCGCKHFKKAKLNQIPRLICQGCGLSKPKEEWLKTKPQAAGIPLRLFN